MAALAGNLVDFTIGEVLAMIAASRKTGLLAVTGGSWDGRVWFEGGGIVAADSLGDSDVDIAVFNISRLRGPAGFGFEISSDLPPQGGNPRPVEEVLARAEDLGHLWREVVATLPSRQVGLELSTQLRDAEVTLSAAEWELVTAVAGTGWLGGVAGLLSQGEFSLSLAVKGLVDRGLVVVRPDRVGDPGQQDPGDQDSGQQDPGDQERGEQDPGGGDGGRGRLEELG
ncbi:MAG: DUF4388 domain-containing protein, partial [Acidimicrobiales bacterium]